MQVAISNIAWDVMDDDIISEILQHHSISAIDIAPGKYFGQMESTTKQEVQVIRNYWASRGIKITGMQSLLFGTKGFNLFSDSTIQKRMLEHLERVCNIAGWLDSPRLVFGSPKNRDCSGIPAEEIDSYAIDFFTQLGNIAARYNVLICLEPNPTCYGANFMTDSLETARIVSLVNHPSIKMQLDTGAITINQENIDQILSSSKHLIGHIHISEPDLKTIGDTNSPHIEYAKAIRATYTDPLITIEMLTARPESAPDAIKKAIQFVVSTYKKPTYETNL